MRSVIGLALVIAVLGAPAAALAAGGHEGVGCIGCHGLRRGDSAAGQFALKSNAKYLNPKTNQPYTGATAFCLACHQEEKNGGQGFLPISRHGSHPFGLAAVNPKVAKVPPQLMKNGGFECTSCHDPHPSNPNYKYLRANVGKKGEKMDQFCGVCHASKGDARTQISAEFFSSSDETAARGTKK
jgi:predicted CXXCH cytochrome family protein